MTIDRTDPHRPSVMDPADYVYVGASDQAEYWGECSYFEMDHETLRRFGVLTTNINRHSPDMVPFYDATADNRPNYRCHHCGKHGINIRYFCFFLHKPTLKVITVGQICAKRLRLADREQLNLQKRAKQWRTENHWTHEHTDEIHFLSEYISHREGGGPFVDFLDSLNSHYNRFQRLTDKQTAALQVAMSRPKPWDCSDGDRRKGQVTRCADEPTEAQIDLIQKLHRELDKPPYIVGSITRLEASDLINALKALVNANKPQVEGATEKQKTYINKLMEERQLTVDERQVARRMFDAGLTRNQASRWIDRLLTLPTNA